MKFIHQHRSNILGTLKRHQVDEAAVDFIKKRGRIQIIHRATGSKFSYLRVKQTTLDPISQGWKHSEYYKIKYNQAKEAPVESWSQVMEAFDRWTRQLSSETQP